MTATRQTPEERRLAEILAADDEVRARLPLPAVADAVRRSTGALSEIVETIMLGYADRPALAERPVASPRSGSGGFAERREPRLATVSYREVWTRARSISTAWQHRSMGILRPGDVICSLASPSVDYAILELATIAGGAVSVPVAPSAPAAEWVSIVAATRPRVLAVGIDLVETVLKALPPDLRPPSLIVLGQGRSSGRVDQAVRDARTAVDKRTGVHSLESLDRIGRDLPAAPLHVPAANAEQLSQILFTSGTTGDPKGAMFPRHLLAGSWRGLAQAPWPGIVPHYAPMSHIAGRIALAGTLARGGTCCFVGSGDMATLLEDFSLVRPTELAVVPRVCEILHERFTSDVEARIAGGAAREDARDQAVMELRDRVLGGRVTRASNGSALLSDELRSFMTMLLGVPLHDGFGTTEAGGPILVDNRILRPQVIDYKLVDVPELGYFGTDRPYPRGELLVKTTAMIPGYHGRPDLTAALFDADGYLRTGDVMAQTGPDELRFVDRRNNVVKLAQAEFVSVARIEQILAGSPLIHQIFVHGQNGRAYLVAVVVPSRQAVETHPDPAALKSALAREIRAWGRAADLRSYEIPRSLIVEHEPFSVDNGLLTGLGKVLRAKARDRFDERLGCLYRDLAAAQETELAAVRHAAADRTVLDTVVHAVGALVGDRATRPVPEMRFVDLGGDSLSALGLSTLLWDSYGVEVPVSVLAGPTTSLRDVADHIEAARVAGTSRPTARSVHGAVSTIRADDLRADALLGTATAAACPAPADRPPCRRTVLLTGGNGFLGRFLALHLLERPDREVVCLVRGRSDEDARRRLEQAFDTGDPGLLDRYRGLAGHRLHVVAGDVDDPRLGLTDERWPRLAERVDTIIHAAAQVNHVLPYEQLFGPNVRGTAAVIDLALTSRLKEVVFLSTIGIADQVDGDLGEQDDIRVTNPTRALSSAYAAGYATSKWAGEVLLRHAHDRHGLPVTVFRSGLILAHRRYVGQLNPQDMFTRLMLSILVTGVAPASFAAHHRTGQQARSAAFGGVPVDFLAESVVRLSGAHSGSGHRTYNAIDPDPRGPSLDAAVDWLIDSGVPVTRIDDHSEWLRRFEIGLRAVPERIAAFTALPLIEAFRRPTAPASPPASASRFRAAVQDAGVGGTGVIPGLSPDLVSKYVTDLAALGLSGGSR
ncbi:carboxylic acid reductase [Rhizomonospora bruguierae]|uniref:carboxylic acid reductase n=1 Tax=Rhizomonospora bruguierae TaxID=1581705 RepID=UPI001BD0369D|nr:carboxylic acid reductase [Micromonospora sp. NBRC 107566]